MPVNNFYTYTVTPFACFMAWAEWVYYCNFYHIYYTMGADTVKFLDIFPSYYDTFKPFWSNVVHLFPFQFLAILY